MESWDSPRSLVRAGLHQLDITPPVGIYHRMWGAATYDRAEGVHRPLLATALALSKHEPGGNAPSVPDLVLVGIDHCLLWPPEMNWLLSEIERATQIPADRIQVMFSHTHGAGLMGWERASLPGGELIRPYLEEVAARIASAVSRATQAMQPCWIDYGAGHCSIAQNRNAWDDDRQISVCGFNPHYPTDDTLLFARITSLAGNIVGTIVNYACHPTTLAWENRLISPDYIGALREVVQSQTNAPCLFLLGTCGDLGPRDGYVGNPEVADRNGRAIGYAALAALNELPTAGRGFTYAGPVLSGATLGAWKERDLNDSQLRAARQWTTGHTTVPLKYRADRPNLPDLHREQQQLAADEQAARNCGDVEKATQLRAHSERATRAISRFKDLPVGDNYPFPLKIWRLGDALWITLNGEYDHWLQKHVRSELSGHPVIIGTIANGSAVWYVVKDEYYGRGLYQEDVAVLERGSLEKLAAHIITAAKQLLDD